MFQVKEFVVNPFQENTYIIYNASNQAWIIDPGMSVQAEFDAVDHFLKSENLSLQAIINTHAHIDHILGVQYVKEKYGIPFYLHTDEHMILTNAPNSAMMFGFPWGETPKVDHWWHSEQTLTLGNETIQLLKVPGHSPGSIAFYHPASKWVIAGDALFQNSIGRTDLPGGNHETLIQSITSKLFTLPEDVIVYPGHGPSTTIGREKMYNPFF